MRAVEVATDVRGIRDARGHDDLALLAGVQVLGHQYRVLVAIIATTLAGLGINRPRVLADDLVGHDLKLRLGVLTACGSLLVPDDLLFLPAGAFHLRRLLGHDPPPTT